jgi:hypothetical protein
VDITTGRAGIAAKLERASQHLQTVRTEAAEYIVAGDYGPRVDFEKSIAERGGESGIACRAFLQPGPPLRLSVLCGDVVHNLRSALDHLANCLVVANEGTPKEGPGGTQFPIASPEKASIADIEGRGVSDNAMGLVRDVQPRAPSDPLAILNGLSNVDKHRTLNLLNVDFQNVDVLDMPQHLGEGLKLETPPFIHGQLIYSIIGATGQMPHTASYRPELAFDDVPGGRIPVMATLERINNFVRNDVIQEIASQELGGELDLPRSIFE